MRDRRAARLESSASGAKASGGVMRGTTGPRPGPTASDRDGVHAVTRPRYRGADAQGSLTGKGRAGSWSADRKFGPLVKGIGGVRAGHTAGLYAENLATPVCLRLATSVQGDGVASSALSRRVNAMFAETQGG